LHNYNLLLERGGLINLETNIPCQLFDEANQGPIIPEGELFGCVPNQRRVSADRLKYLDVTSPGRLHHFFSFADLLYWERFELEEKSHELSRGKVTTLTPFTRLPKEITLFSKFATNSKILRAVADAI